MTTEEILALRIHALGLGIYDEDGADGNIFIDNIPDIIPNGKDELIAVYKSSSFTREIKLLGGAIKPLTTIYVKGKDLLETARKANEIANKLSQDSYKTEDYIVYQTFIFNEPVREDIDNKDNYIYAFEVVQAIEFLK